MTRRNLGLARGIMVAGVVLALVACLGAPRADAAAAKRRTAAQKKSASTSESNVVLVRIGAETITRGDAQKRIDILPEQYRANYSTPEGRQQLVDRLVEERVWLAMAMKNGVAERPEVRQQLDQQRRDLLVRTYLNEVMSANPAPSDSEAQAYYQEHLADYRMPGTVTLSHIQARTEAEGKRLKQWARGKNDWAALVKRYSADKNTRETGGSLGTVTRDGVFASLGTQPALAESAFALGQGGIGGPYKTDKGWHVIRVDELKPESSRSFEQVRQVILRQLSSKRSQEFYQTRLDQARRSLGVKPDSAAIKGFVSQRKTAREMFNEAQALGAPEPRIEGYRKLLGEYPNSDVSPQAQFMVGFIYSEELKNYDEADKAFRELLRRYPKSELAGSAQWMVDHMRSEEAPPFDLSEADSSQVVPKPRGAAKGPSGKP